MSDYARANSGGATHFTDKDALTTGDANKVVVGEQFDAEFEALVTAVATKYDSGDIASQAQAEGESSNVVLITPLRLAQWSDDNAGIIGDVQALTDPAANRLLGFDNSANVGKFFTAATGLVINATSVGLSHLGLEALTDPSADRIFFWDDGASASKFLAANGGLEISTTNLRIADQSAAANIPVSFSSGTLGFDITALDAAVMTGIAAADTFLVDDGGAIKKIEYQELGFRVQTGQGTQSLAADDMNTVMEFTATATLTLPKNTTAALPVGATVVVNVKHASQQLTITAATNVTLVSVHHAAGGSAASDTVVAGGSAVLIKTATDVWLLSGDIIT